MPQLEFTWWIINFFIVWTADFTLLIVLSIPNLSTPTTLSKQLDINKSHVTWQWS
uniref:ATP synthase protein 8 n=1 Tax=Arbacia lixula TaxID=7640 RepID=ATP8_ARBLI|nr:RecName: Full=ATP synthase protein 8; AltName: Full=A6L; AltName: Full=F-ATPase subunit 8 [Arbacia lixula]